MSAFPFPKAAHLRSPAEFNQTYDRKCKASTEHVLVFASLNGTTTTRCGLSVSKKNGGAVVRNKIKRRLREAFRHERSALPEGLDLILIPKNNLQSSVQDYRNSLRLLVEKLNTRLRSNPHLQHT